jgi:hypothetical protein
MIGVSTSGENTDTLLRAQQVGQIQIDVRYEWGNPTTDTMGSLFDLRQDGGYSSSSLPTAFFKISTQSSLTLLVRDRQRLLSAHSNQASKVAMALLNTQTTSLPVPPIIAISARCRHLPLLQMLLSCNCAAQLPPQVSMLPVPLLQMVGVPTTVILSFVPNWSHGLLTPTTESAVARCTLPWLQLRLPWDRRQLVAANLLQFLTRTSWRLPWSVAGPSSMLC